MQLGLNQPWKQGKFFHSVRLVLATVREDSDLVIKDGRRGEQMDRAEIAHCKDFQSARRIRGVMSHRNAGYRAQAGHASGGRPAECASSSDTAVEAGASELVPRRKEQYAHGMKWV